MPAAFLEATQNVQAIGLSFGGLCYFETGVTASPIAFSILYSTSEQLSFSCRLLSKAPVRVEKGHQKGRPMLTLPFLTGNNALKAWVHQACLVSEVRTQPFQ